MRKDKEAFDTQLITVKVNKPEATNFILGQTHFIKSVEDIHEALVAAVPGIKFGVAFGEASGKCLLRCSGTVVELARKNAKAIGAGTPNRPIQRLLKHYYADPSPSLPPSQADFDGTVGRRDLAWYLWRCHWRAPNWLQTFDFASRPIWPK